MFWSEAMMSPPASGIPAARSETSRRSAARMTCLIHSPAGSSAVRHAWLVSSLVSGCPRRTASSSPALERHLASPE